MYQWIFILFFIFILIFFLSKKENTWWSINNEFSWIFMNSHFYEQCMSRCVRILLLSTDIISSLNLMLCLKVTSSSDKIQATYACMHGFFIAELAEVLVWWLWPVKTYDTNFMISHDIMELCPHIRWLMWLDHSPKLMLFFKPLVTLRIYYYWKG